MHRIREFIIANYCKLIGLAVVIFIGVVLHGSTMLLTLTYLLGVTCQHAQQASNAYIAVRRFVATFNRVAGEGGDATHQFDIFAVKQGRGAREN